jgi:hypothetical protein
MALDFYQTFRLGRIGNGTTITTTDIDGLNLVRLATGGRLIHKLLLLVR